jgi:uncharacterized membrane protein
MRDRWLALDVFRFSAIALMIQGHVFSVLLDRATKAESWYPHHSFVHGYTAPMFLFGAGLAFGVTTFRVWREHASFGPAARKRMGRYAMLIAIGYALHVPAGSLSRLFALDPDTYASIARVDVLQHIGVALAIAQLLVAIVRSERAFAWIALAIGVACASLAPWVWALDLTSAPRLLSGYLNTSTGSPFPLVPWAGFTFCGIATAHFLFARSDERTFSARAAWPLAALAAILLVVPVLIDRFGGLSFLPPHNFWKVNPLFFAWRLGNAIAVLSILCFAERWVAHWARARRWIEITAAESLAIYVVHIVIIHGSALGPGFKRSEILREGTHGLAVASAVAIGLFVLMILVARTWHETKRQNWRVSAIRLSFAGALAYAMLVPR